MTQALLVLVLVALVMLLESVTARPFLASHAGLALARKLGGRAVASVPTGLPKDVVVLEVPTLPAAGFRPAAQTWGTLILVAPGALAGVHGARLVRHELEHVRQYRRLTSLGFLVSYATAWLVGLALHRDLVLAYRAIGLEREARAAEDAA